MKRYTKYLFLFCFSFFIKEDIAQNNVGIGTLTPANDAVLELKSTNQGILVPRLSTLQRLAIPTPSNGLLVYDTNYNCFYYYNAPAAVWNSMCAGPSAPTIKANVQMYSSKGVSTLINDTNFITVNGLSVTVTLVDTATINLTSNGTIICYDSAEVFTSDLQLFQNSVPIPGTEQSIFFGVGGYFVGYPYPQSNLIWSVSTVIPSLPPGTYLFELKAKIPPKEPRYTHGLPYASYYAACNHIKQNQGVITAEVIY